jgi:predicted nucleotidyltransferase
MVYGLPERVVDKINGVFSSHASVEKAVLYGSRAKGGYKNGSDIDLTLFGALAFRELLQIETELDDLLLPWMIDLSLYDQIDNRLLRDHIERAGKIFYERKWEMKKTSQEPRAGHSSLRTKRSRQ